jgi:endonuclease YncB( thermonuclease family)
MTPQPLAHPEFWNRARVAKAARRGLFFKESREVESRKSRSRQVP